MKMANKQVFEVEAQNALRLIENGIHLEMACKQCSNEVVTPAALKSYIKTHYCSRLPATDQQTEELFMDSVDGAALAETNPF